MIDCFWEKLIYNNSSKNFSLCYIPFLLLLKKYRVFKKFLFRLLFLKNSNFELLVIFLLFSEITFESDIVRKLSTSISTFLSKNPYYKWPLFLSLNIKQCDYRKTKFGSLFSSFIKGISEFTNSFYQKKKLFGKKKILLDDCFEFINQVLKKIQISNNIYINLWGRDFSSNQAINLIIRTVQCNLRKAENSEFVKNFSILKKSLLHFYRLNFKKNSGFFQLNEWVQNQRKKKNINIIRTREKNLLQHKFPLYIFSRVGDSLQKRASLIESISNFTYYKSYSKIFYPIVLLFKIKRNIHNFRLKQDRLILIKFHSNKVRNRTINYNKFFFKSLLFRIYIIIFKIVRVKFLLRYFFI